MADEKETTEETPDREIVARRGAGGTDITGGTDKTGRGGLAESDKPPTGSTGVEETGDLTGASTTHAGAGGQMENMGGTGTAPTE
jgi:hypothetical protein